EAFRRAEAEAQAMSEKASGEENDRAPLLTASANAGVPKDAVGTSSEATDLGGLVAFFAAQTVETTPEMPRPKGVEDAKPYRQLAQSVLQAYSAENIVRPTPLFEGDLDAPVFGQHAGDYVRQWPLKVGKTAITVAAGQLHGLVQGAKLAVLPKPGSKAEEAV